MTTLLTILIPTLPVRIKYLDRLLESLNQQIFNFYDPRDIDFITDADTSITIGEKRNRMLAQATGKYICFFDDDDMPSNDYIEKIMEGVYKDVDCCSLTGLYKPDTAKEQLFVHSIRYNDYYEEDGILIRCPNHLNTVKRELAIQCTFPHWDRSEDTNYAFQLRDKGLLKTEHWVEGVIYTYLHINDKKRHDYSILP